MGCIAVAPADEFDDDQDRHGQAECCMAVVESSVGVSSELAVR